MSENSFIRQRCLKEHEPNILMHCQLCSESFFSPILAIKVVRRINEQKPRIYKLCEGCDKKYCAKRILLTSDFTEWLVS